MKYTHVLEKWESLNREYLEQMDGKLLAVTFSAGKDSSAMLELLNAVKKKYNFELLAFTYAFPRHRYTEEFERILKEYWTPKGVDIIYRSSDVDDSVLDETENPCRPCQNLRKQALPEVFSLVKRPPRDIVLVSGHSLWDLAGYALNRLVGDSLADSSTHSEVYSAERFLEISQRFYIFLSMPEGYSVYRPMLVLNADEIEFICEEKLLPILEVSCRYSLLRPKKVLGGFFEKFGYRFSYRQVFEFARTYLNIADLETIQSITREEYLTKRF
ncbi:MAG: ATP-binding protein [bacterium]